jgi:hypothetical protein
MLDKLEGLIPNYHAGIQRVIGMHLGKQNVPAFVDELSQYREHYLRTVQRLRFAGVNKNDCDKAERQIITMTNSEIQRCHQLGRIAYESSPYGGSRSSIPAAVTRHIRQRLGTMVRKGSKLSNG